MTPTTTSSPPAAAPWFRHRWPWFLMLGPFLVIVAGSYTSYLAVTRQDALVVGDYYKQGKAINQDLRRDRAAARMGMSASVRYDAANARLEGRVMSMGEPHTGSLILHLAHATIPEKDIRLPLQTGADGRFSIALPLLERSRWQVLIEDASRSWKLEGSWSWPASHEVVLVADAAS